MTCAGVVEEHVDNISVTDDGPCSRMSSLLQCRTRNETCARLVSSCVSFCGRGSHLAGWMTKAGWAAGPSIVSGSSSSSNITTTINNYNNSSRTCCAACSRQRRPATPLWAGNMTMLMFVVVVVGTAGVRQAEGAAVPGIHLSPALSNTPLPPPAPGRDKDGGQKDDPLARLSKVFGISRIPARIVHRTPPQYMTELYQAVADTRSGLTKASGPYNANTIRSFPDRDTVQQLHFHYNVSHLARDGAELERVLEAEFHIFKMKPRLTRSAEAPPPHHLQLRVYQVLDVDNMHSADSLRLLDVRRISTHAHGWLTFKVTKAVEKWRSEAEPNHGLLVMAQSSHGELYNGSYIRFAQRNQHHDSKQPILVVFTDDGKVRESSFVSTNDTDYLEIQQEVEDEAEERVEEENEDGDDEGEADERRQAADERQQPPFTRSPDFRQAVLMLNERARAGSTPTSHSGLTSSSSAGLGRRRKKREAEPSGGSGGGSGSGSGGGKGQKKKKQPRGRRKRMYDLSGYRYRRSCARHKMYVDFDEIGWSGWIISPKGYDAYHCAGECPFPLGQSQKPTNHATVQSIVHALRVGNNVGTPCCVPNKLFSISLLYFDDDENVILKQYDDMVAASCGCH